MYFGFSDMTLSYKDKVVLKDFSLEIPKGSIVSLIGKNGSGKSTLLKTVSGTVKPDKGSVIFCNRNIRSYNPRLLAQKIASLPQFHKSPSDIDVRTLVSYGRYPYIKFFGTMKDEDKKIIDKVLSITSLTDVQYRNISTLSGGEKQRTWIAMTICQQPEILILDEPVTYLDIGYQMEILELIKELNKTFGITILMVLHDLNLASRYSDLLCVVKDSKLYSMGPPKNIMTEENLRDVFNIEAFIKTDEEHSSPYFIPHKNIK